MAEKGANVPFTGGLLAGMRGVIFGVANNRSIAWGIAKATRAAGAELALTFQGEALEKRVRPLAAELGAHVLGHCDVTDGATIDAVFAEAQRLWGGLDFVVHCIAFADKDELTGRYVATTEANFNKSLAISCYSFTALAQRAEKMMTNGGSLLTLTYYGAEKWMPHYNVMGVAKAALEASVRYLAADLGAAATVDANAVADVAEAVIALTRGGAHVSIDALGHPTTCFNSISSLRKRGKHIQVGLMLAEQSAPRIPMDKVVARELELLGSHGMQAHRYGAMLDMVQSGKLRPERLIGERISLEQSIDALTNMDKFESRGVTVVTRF